MNKIKDERLVLRNLKNIRIAFLFQTLGIITILCKQHFMDGKSFSDIPLFLVFILTKRVKFSHPLQVGDE